MRRFVFLGLVLGVAACSGDTGPAGSKGSKGAAGDASLVNITAEGAGGNCAAGGLRIDGGVDADGDGVLDTDEIDSTSFVCNGPAGANGAAGTPGDQCIIEKNGRCVGGNLKGVDLTGRDLAGIDLSNADLSWAILDDVDFSGATLNGTKFDNAKLRGSARLMDFRNASLIGASFRGAQLDCFTFHSARMSGSFFDDARLTGSSGCVNGEESTFTEADLTSASFVRARLTGELTGVAPVAAGEILFGKVSATGTQWDDAKLWNVRFSDATTLANADFNGATLFETQMSSNVVITSANFSFASLINADMPTSAVPPSTVASLYNNTYHAGVTGFTALTWPPTAIDMTSTAQSGKDWSRADTARYEEDDVTAYAGYQFNGPTTKLMGRSFYRRELNGTTFFQADCTGASFLEAVLTNEAGAATFEQAILNDTDFRRVSCDNPDADGCLAVLFNSADMVQAWLTDTAIDWGNFTGVDFTRATLIGTDLTGSTVSSLTLTGAYRTANTTIPSAVLTPTILIASGGNYSTPANLNLTRINIPNSGSLPDGVDGANFQTANLTNAVFGEGNSGVSAIDTNFQNANLSGAQLAYLVANDPTNDTSFQTANLTNANLSCALLEGAQFQSATMAGTNLLSANTGLDDGSVDTTKSLGNATWSGAVCPDGFGSIVEATQTCLGHDIDPNDYGTLCP